MSPEAGGGPDPRGDRIDHVVAGWARRLPGAVAVVQDGHRLGYADLLARAEEIADALRGSGVCPGDTVATALDRSAGLVAALLGIARARATAVVLDPAWPAWRTADVLDLAVVHTVVTVEPSGTPIAQARPARTVLRPVAPAGAPPGSPAASPEAACVVFPRGARPPGVLIGHRGLIAALTSTDDGAAPHYLSAGPLGGEAFTHELWAALLNGGSAVFPSAGATPGASALRVGIRAGADHARLSAAAFREFTEADPEVFRGLRGLVVAEGPMRARDAREVLRRFSDLRLRCVYGTAETSLVAASQVVGEKDLDEWGDEPPIGRPVPGTEILLVDDDGRPVPVGTTGEIAVTGHAMALGLLSTGHEDQAWAVRQFATNSDGQRPPGVYLRTGDLAKVDADGGVRRRGRRTDLIRLGDRWIDPGLAETALAAEHRVRACVVFPFAADSGDVLACAYTTHDGEPLPERVTTGLLVSRLAADLRPSLLLHVQRLPAAALTRADFSSLSQELRARTTTGEAPGQAPPTDLLIEVRALLGVPALSPADDLLAAGVSSLDAVRVAAVLSAHCGRKVTVGEVYEHRRLSAFPSAASGPTDSPASDKPTAPTGPSEPGTDRLPLSHAQHRFLFAEALAPGSADNLIVLAYALDGPLDPEALHSAVDDLGIRHQVLRTVYLWERGRPLHRVVADRHAPWEEAPPPPGHTGMAAEEIARHVTADWWDTPFRLDREIPVRGRLCRLTPDRALLCLQFHHIAFDGWSEGALLTDLKHAYRERTHGRDPRFTPAPGYPLVGRSEEQHLANWSAHDLPYWRETLAQCPPHFLPRPETHGHEAPAAEMSRRIGATTVRRLTGAALRNGGPPLAALSAASALVLARHFGVDEVCVGTLTAGRFDPATDQVVGYLVNPFAIPLRGLRRPAGVVLEEAAQRVVGGLEHARTPFDELVRELRPDRDRHPWFEAWVILQHPPPAAALGPVALRPLRIAPPRTSRSWMVEAFPAADRGWDVVTTWRTDIMDEATGAALADALAAALDEVAASGAVTFTARGAREGGTARGSDGR